MVYNHHLTSKNKNMITFDKSARNFVLSAFNKRIGEDGYIVEENNPSQKVLTPDGSNIQIDQFAGIKKGSEIFIKTDIISLVKLAGDFVKL